MKYNLSHALAISRTTGRIVKCHNRPDISKLKFIGTELQAFNMNRGFWSPLQHIPLSLMDPELSWEIAEDREPTVFTAECLGVDLTPHGVLYNCTMALVLDATNKIVEPEFFTNRKVKITIEVQDD